MQKINSTRNRIALCIPYFGKLNKLFLPWIISAAHNTDYDFLIFTNDKDSFVFDGVYSNVKFFHFEFKDMQSLISKKISKFARLTTPYKLCDYKPAYGLIFEDYLNGYDFWGYCDIDLVFGRINHFITDDILAKYDKILTLGHLSLIRNTKELKRAFMYNPHNGSISYPFVFDKNTPITIFDEKQFNKICEMQGFRIYDNKSLYCDLYVYEYGFKNTQDNKIISDYFTAFWDNGKLMIKQYEKKPIEQMYIHFQKRSVDVVFNKKTPNKFLMYPNICTDENIRNLDEKCVCYFDKKYAKLVKNKFMKKRFQNLLKLNKIRLWNAKRKSNV